MYVCYDVLLEDPHASPHTSIPDTDKLNQAYYQLCVPDKFYIVPSVEQCGVRSQIPGARAHRVCIFHISQITIIYNY